MGDVTAIMGAAEDAKVDEKPKTAEKWSLRTFTNFETEFKRLKTVGTEVAKITEENRRVRAAIVDVKNMQNEDELKGDETYIAVPLIAQNIQRALPPRLQYLKSANRLAYFKPVDQTKSSTNLDSLMAEFTRVQTYDGWETSFIQWIDSTELHGCGFNEVVYDPTKPGHNMLDYIQYENLYFDRTLEDIQDAPMIARVYRVTRVSAEKLSRRVGFTEDAHKALMDRFSRRGGSGADQSSTEQGEGPSDTYQIIYRTYYKEDGVVWITWTLNDYNDFLKDPVKLFVGIWKKETVIKTPKPEEATLQVQMEDKVVPADVEDYPIFPMRRLLTEDPRFCSQMGAAQMDYYMQDAASAILSGMVIGLMRSLAVMWCPVGSTPEDGQGKAKQIQGEFKRDAIWSREMKSFSPQAPPPEMANMLQLLLTMNAESAGQIAYATNNRQDSRKTATEVQSANNQNQMLTSMQVLMLSLAIRPVLILQWQIVQSCAMVGQIQFCVLPNGLNDVALIAQRYDLKPAGDVDYVESQTMLAHLQQDAMQLAQTPVGALLLRKYLEQRYPSFRAELDGILNQMTPASPVAQQLNAVSTLLKEVVTDEKGNLKPEFAQYKKELGEIAMKTQQILQAGGGGTAYGQPQQQGAQ